MAQSITPAACINNNVDCTCYAPDYALQIADSLDELAECKITLEAKEGLLRRTLPEAPPGSLWYQEPTWIFGGFIVSVSVTAIVTMYLVSGKK